MNQLGAQRIVELDLDGTLCTKLPYGDPDYAKAQPLRARIAEANRRFAGDFVRIKTGRGATTGKDWRAVTERQLREWGLRYDELKFREDDADLRVDDKAENAVVLDGEKQCTHASST